MVGHGPARWAETCEALSMGAVIIAAIVLATPAWKTSRDARHGGLLALSWADAAGKILADAQTLAGWRVEPVDRELAAIECVRALKIVRAP